MDKFQNVDKNNLIFQDPVAGKAEGRVPGLVCCGSERSNSCQQK